MLCSVPHMLSHVFQIGWTILLTNLQNLSTWCYLHQSLSFFVFICVCFFIVTISFFFLFHPIRSPFPDFHKLNEDGELWLVYEGLKETNRLKNTEMRACRNVWESELSAFSSLYPPFLDWFWSLSFLKT